MSLFEELDQPYGLALKTLFILAKDKRSYNSRDGVPSIELVQKAAIKGIEYLFENEVVKKRRGEKGNSYYYFTDKGESLIMEIQEIIESKD